MRTLLCEFFYAAQPLSSCPGGAPISRNAKIQGLLPPAYPRHALFGAQSPCASGGGGSGEGEPAGIVSGRSLLETGSCGSASRPPTPGSPLILGDTSAAKVASVVPARSVVVVLPSAMPAPLAVWRFNCRQ